MDTISSPLSKYIKRNNKSNEDSKQLFTNHFNDIFSLDQAVQTLQSNISLVKSSIDSSVEASLSQSKDPSSSLSLLQSLYRSSYKDYKSSLYVNDLNELRLMFSSFGKAFFPLTLAQKKKIDSVMTQSKVTNSKLDSIAYDQLKKGTIDYYETSKSYNTHLIIQQGLISDMKIKAQKTEDCILMTSIVRQSFKDLGLMYENFSNGLLSKLNNITKENSAVFSNTKTHLDRVESYYDLLNSIYYLKEIPKAHLTKIQQLLSVQLKGNSELLRNALINSNQIMSRMAAFRLVYNSFGGVIPIIRKSLLFNKNIPIRQKATKTVYDVALCLNTKRNLLMDIRENDMQKLAKHLNDFERHAISLAFVSNLFPLYLYGMTHQFSNVIYDHFVNSLIKPN